MPTATSSQPIIVEGDHDNGNGGVQLDYVVVPPGGTAADNLDWDYVFYNGSYYQIHPSLGAVVTDSLYTTLLDTNNPSNGLLPLPIDPSNLPEPDQTIYDFTGNSVPGFANQLLTGQNQIQQISPNLPGWYPGHTPDTTNGSDNGTPDERIDPDIVGTYEELLAEYGVAPEDIYNILQQLGRLTPTKPSPPTTQPSNTSPSQPLCPTSNNNDNDDDGNEDDTE